MTQNVNIFGFPEHGDAAALCNVKTHMLMTTNGYLKIWKK